MYTEEEKILKGGKTLVLGGPEGCREFIVLVVCRVKGLSVCPGVRKHKAGVGEPHDDEPVTAPRASIIYC